MCVKTRQNKIKNDNIIDNIEVEHIIEKMVVGVGIG